MTIPAGPDQIPCQKCGALWPKAQVEANPDMYHFQPKIGGEISSSADIAAAGLEMTHCPKCPLPKIDKGMQKGDSRIMGDNY